MNFFIKLKTLWQLGVFNIIRVTLYRLGLLTGLHPVLRCKFKIGGTHFFTGVSPHDKHTPTVKSWRENALYFGWHQVPLEGKPPQWHFNPFNSSSFEEIHLPWWCISDFNLNIGDIKTIWEASRFDWVLAHAQRGLAGSQDALAKLNEWLADWCMANPAYCGPNWKCGQEASIRVLHLAVAARLLRQETKSEPDLLNLVQSHLYRIKPTLSYAMAQDNNHGTSEAAALFIGGTWCEAHGNSKGSELAISGRRALENRSRRLIMQDGSFSQYSVNYHRVMLDTFCMVELWRRWIGLQKFSPVFYEKVQAAVLWLYRMVDPDSGDAPNLGANDGARLLPLSDTDFCDYRPSVQMAMVLFFDKLAYKVDGIYNLPLILLGIDLPENCAAPPASTQFDNGGFAVLHRDQLKVFFRYPRYKFRPRHCDAMHVDLWLGSNNLLRDAGSYCYNTEEPWQSYFSSTAAHNTVQFDGREQMPRLGRFLLGAWLKSRDVTPIYGYEDSLRCEAGYRDWKGACHHRSVGLKPDCLIVKDKVSGFVNRAVLRWRLLPADWCLDDKVLSCGSFVLKISADVPIVRCQLVDGWESRYYLKKSWLPVLEVEICEPGVLTSNFSVKSE